MLKEIMGTDFSDYRMTLVGSVQFAKTAEEVYDDARSFIETLQPNERVFYVHVVALGAGEYWGPNRNGDYFPEEELKKSYKSFLSGHVFRLHENKDPQKAIGKVIAAFWNDRMKRVELVLEMDREKAADILQRLENGETVDVSMGCKVEFDICSICGHRSRTRAEYCEHLRNQMGAILPDGRRVYAINPNPKFFDLSFVRRGADPTAKVLVKIAEELGGLEVGKMLKSGALSKNVPAEAVSLIDRLTRNGLVVRAHTLQRPPIPPEVLHEVLDHIPPEGLLANSLFAGLTFQPDELRTIFDRFYTPEPAAVIRLVKAAPIARRVVRFIRGKLGPFVTQDGVVNVDLALKIEKTAEEKLADAALTSMLGQQTGNYNSLLAVLISLLLAELQNNSYYTVSDGQILNRLHISPRNFALLTLHGNIPAGLLLTSGALR